ncbi:MAG: hypothetical protein ACI4KF_05635 [Huintestinicola sp.]
MNNKNISSQPKIGTMQITILFSMLGVLSSLLFLDFPSSDNPLGTVLSNAAAGAVLRALLVIPIVLFTKKCSGQSITSALGEKCRPAAVIISLLYGAVLVSASAYCLKEFGRFAGDMIYPQGGATLCIILLGLACMYAAWGGTPAVCRMSTVMLVLLCINVLYLFISFLINGAAAGVYPVRPEMTNIPDSLTEISVCGLIPLCFLCRHASSGGKHRAMTGAFGAVAGILVVSAVLAYLTYVTLGGYSDLCRYPLYEADIYASRNFGITPDGFFFVFYLTAAAAVISLFLSSAGECISDAFNGRGKLPAVICSAAAIVIAAVNSALQDGITDVIMMLCRFAGANITLLFVIPLLMYAFLPASADSHRKEKSS